MRAEPQVIFIRKAGVKVVKDNCIRCHEKQMSCMQCHRKFNESGDEYTSTNREFSEYHSERLCWECHREVPHGRVNSLSSVPFARVPVPSSPVPDWMKKIPNSKFQIPN
jgi:cytochrome c nitrite reductase small subunit